MNSHFVLSKTPHSCNSSISIKTEKNQYRFALCLIRSVAHPPASLAVKRCCRRLIASPKIRRGRSTSAVAADATAAAVSEHLKIALVRRPRHVSKNVAWRLVLVGLASDAIARRSIRRLARASSHSCGGGGDRDGICVRIARGWTLYCVSLRPRNRDVKVYCLLSANSHRQLFLYAHFISSGMRLSRATGAISEISHAATAAGASVRYRGAALPREITAMSCQGRIHDANDAILCVYSSYLLRDVKEDGLHSVVDRLGASAGGKCANHQLCNKKRTSDIFRVPCEQSLKIQVSAYAGSAESSRCSLPDFVT
jgi:hypothetical protein